MSVGENSTGDLPDSICEPDDRYEKPDSRQREIELRAELGQDPGIDHARADQQPPADRDCTERLSRPACPELCRFSADNCFSAH